MEHRAERRAIVELARLGNARHTAEFPRRPPTLAAFLMPHDVRGGLSSE